MIEPCGALHLSALPASQNDTFDLQTTEQFRQMQSALRHGLISESVF